MAFNNFDILFNQYRQKGRALKGYRFLKNNIENKQEKVLAVTLRDHRKEPIITKEEVELRNNVDSLLEFYGIVEIGLISGAVSAILPQKFEKEIILILNNSHVKMYLKHYPLLLPKILLHHVIHYTGDLYLNEPKNSEMLFLFDKFLILNERKQDSDIELFLWILDDGVSYDNIQIIDFWNIIGSKNSIKTNSQKNRNSSINKLLWGFIKYLDFLNDYYSLLEQSKDFKLLKSAFWHQQSYFFSQMNEQLGDIIGIAIPNIIKTVRSITTNDLHNVQDYFLFATDDYSTPLNSNIEDLRVLQEKIEYLINNDLGQPLNVFNIILQGSNVLTEREFEIILLIKQGLSSRRIAEILCVSPFTVNTLLRKILKKTSKTHIPDLIVEMMKKGLL